MIIVNNINPNKLHDELISAGIKPIFLKNDKKENEILAESTQILFEEDTDMNLVQEIIKQHNPEPVKNENENTIYSFCKNMIETRTYKDKQDMEFRLDVFYAKDRLTNEEYQNLVGMLSFEK